MTATENPIDQNERLQELLSVVGSVKSRKAYGTWRKEFLELYTEALDDNGILNGKDGNYRLLKQLKQLEHRTKLVLDGPLKNGSVSNSTNGRRLLTNLTQEVARTETKVQELLPKTAADEEKFGFDKFELAAVLLEDGFCGYDWMKASRKTLDSIADALVEFREDQEFQSELQILRRYSDAVESFVRVMEDLRLVTIMDQCVDVVYHGKERPAPKPPAPPEDDENEDSTGSDPTPSKPKSSKKKKKKKKDDGNATASDEDDDDVDEPGGDGKKKKKKKKEKSSRDLLGKPSTKKKKKSKKSGPGGGGDETITDDDTVDSADRDDDDDDSPKAKKKKSKRSLASSSSKEGKPKSSRSKGKKKGASPSNEDDEEDDPGRDRPDRDEEEDESEEDDEEDEEGQDGPPPVSEFLLYFDPKTNSIGRIDRGEAIKKSNQLVETKGDDGGGAETYKNVVTDQGEKDDIWFMLKKLERQKPKEASWLDEIKKEKAAAKGGGDPAGKKKIHKSTAMISKRNLMSPTNDGKKVDIEKMSFRNPLAGSGPAKPTSFRSKKGPLGSTIKKPANNEDFRAKYKQMADKPDTDGWSKLSSRALQ